MFYLLMRTADIGHHVILKVSYFRIISWNFSIYNQGHIPGSKLVVLSWKSSCLFSGTSLKNNVCIQTQVNCAFMYGNFTYLH